MIKKNKKFWYLNEIGIERRWLRCNADDKENNDDSNDEDKGAEAREQLFRQTCEMLASADCEEKLEALHFIETDSFVANCCDWFYNFAYFLLKRHIMFSEHLSVCGLTLIESLEANPTTNTSVSIKQVRVKL